MRRGWRGVKGLWGEREACWRQYAVPVSQSSLSSLQGSEGLEGLYGTQASPLVGASLSQR